MSFAEFTVGGFQLTLQHPDLARGRSLRLRQNRRNAFQVDGDLRQLRSLHAQGTRRALYFGCIVDRVIAVLAVPRRFESALCLSEGRLSLAGQLSGIVKSLGKCRDLRRSTALQGRINGPRVAAGRGD
jgi:hypothetical protein